MILAVSRFKVLNWRQADVKESFFNRPRLVDNAPGFLGMETFTLVKDEASFYLVTRWTDEGSFRRWHKSPAHHLSHRGIPKGLRLDPEFTKVIVLERLTSQAHPDGFPETVADSGALLSDSIEGSDLVHLVLGDREGRIKLCNRAVVHHLGLPREKLLNQPLASFLVEPDAARLGELIASGTRDSRATFLLNFVNSTYRPYTLVCRIDVQPDHFVILGEPAVAEELRLQAELTELNNQLAILARENARQTKELAQANARLKSTLEELETTHWHLRKVAEVLPICMVCGKIKAGEAKWEGVAEYFHNNALLVSHGCCPDCQKSLTKEWDLK